MTCTGMQHLTSSAKESLSPAILELCEATLELSVRLHRHIRRQAEQGTSEQVIDTPLRRLTTDVRGEIKLGLPPVYQLFCILNRYLSDLRQVMTVLI